MTKSTRDARLETPDYVELATMPPDGAIPDGVAIIGSTLYVGGEAKGTVLDVSSRLSGGFVITYFTVD